MPYLNVKISAPPSAELARKIAASLTDLTTDLLGKKREVTSVAVEFVPEGQWFMGGADLAEQGLATFYLEVKITAGTNTKDEKAAYIREAFEGMAWHLGPLHPTSYIVIHEIDGDGWGYEGRTQEYRYIRNKPL